MQKILDAILSDDVDSIGSLPIPETYRGITVHADEADMFAGMPSQDKDPRQSLHLDDVPVPELGPGEALVAVMASAVNYNTVWTSIFEPLPTFQFLRHYGKQDRWAARHDLPYHVMGSDAAGVIVRTGAGVRRWQIGDHVVVSPVVVDDQEPASQQSFVVIGTSIPSARAVSCRSCMYAASVLTWYSYSTL